MIQKLTKVLTPPDYLARRLRRPGGLTKTKAVSKAKQAVEQLRSKLCKTLVLQIDRLERETAGRSELSKTDLDRARSAAAVIYNLAGTYGYFNLQAVAVSLLDCLEAMRESGQSCAAPIAVHARAARLLSPDSDASNEVAAPVLEQLRLVVSHLRVPDPCGSENCRKCPGRS